MSTPASGGAIPQRLSLITLGVRDVARSTAFYEALGWVKSSESPPEVSFFPMAGGVLAVWGRGDLAADAGVTDEGVGFRGVAVAINLESADAVDAAYATWVAAGGAGLTAPHATDWGGYTSYVADLDGHLWEIAHNPAWPLDERGLPVLPA